MNLSSSCVAPHKKTFRVMSITLVVTLAVKDLVCSMLTSSEYFSINDNIHYLLIMKIITLTPSSSSSKYFIIFYKIKVTRR